MLKSSACPRCCYSTLRGWMRHPTPPLKKSFHSSTTLCRQPQPTRSHSPRKSEEQSFGHGNSFADFQKAFPMARAPEKKDKKEAMRKDLSFALRTWCFSPKIMGRLVSIGLPQPVAKSLLQNFVSSTPENGWFPPEEDKWWGMDKFFPEMKLDHRLAIDRMYTRRLFHWVKRNPQLFTSKVNITFSALMEAVDYSHPAEWYPKTLVLRRKVIMHVGPTNSGKTHNALRALAGARLGVYAGPLRLLAVEIFDRFNNGSILPLDADTNAAPGTYKRVCNLLTGEEIRTVDEDAGLTSCTVEMLSSLTRYDVAVIDEIQMLTDPERGGAWTAAVLGTCADELHLCGEESVVPLVQEILKDTGDEVIVNRYERLTPLVAAPSSLNGNLKGIEKGDCVVAFSRNRIFALKKAIEEKTGMRCALAYGRLPPEVRSEQAELFNDPNSGYDVLVGSDAIGMGLNLRIKRIIFDSVLKWDGVQERSLSLSQIKQIAGRAGRFGLHDEETTGVVTALNEADMGLIRKALSSIIKPDAQRAVLPRRTDEHAAVERLLVPPASFASVFEIQSYLAQHGQSYTMREITGGMRAAEAIDALCGSLTLEERMLVFNAPVQWRDDVLREAMIQFLAMYLDAMNVDLKKALEELNLLDDLLHVQKMRDDKEKGDIPSMKHLQSLEGLYRVLVVYKWFHNRFPLAFCHGALADDLKTQSEDAIEWCLQRIRAKETQRPVDTAGEACQKKEQSANVHSEGHPKQFSKRPLVQMRRIK